MTTTVANSGDRFQTSGRRVAIASVVVFICIVALVFVVSTSLVQELFGISRQIEARVPTFLVRLAFLITGLVAAFFAITGLSYYKRNKVA